MLEEPTVSRNMHASLFNTLFRQSEHFIDLYEACSGFRLDKNDLKPFALDSDLIDRPFINDASHITSDKRLILMAEHLSNPKRNVAQRDLLYYTSLVQQWLTSEGKSMSRGASFDIPMPEFYIIYSGKQTFNEQYLTFGNSFLRVNAKLVDIDFDKLTDKQPSNILAGYSFFLKQMEVKQAEGETRTAAFNYAVQQCIRNSYLHGIVEKEEFMMFNQALIDFLYPTAEQLQEYALAKAKEEGVERGLEQGQLKQLVFLIHRKLLKSKTREQIIDELEMDEDGIRVLDNFDSYVHLL